MIFDGAKRARGRIGGINCEVRVGNTVANFPTPQLLQSVPVACTLDIHQDHKSIQFHCLSLPLILDVSKFSPE